MRIFGRAAVEEEPDERGKVFNWTREKRIWVHLTAFLLFSILIHGSGFYLFKVVYPSPVRVEPEPDGITVTQFNGEDAGQTIFHLHFHIIPRSEGLQLKFHARDMEKPEVLAAMAERIRAALE